MHTFLSYFLKVTEILFPRTCSGCGENGSFLCNKCLDESPRALPLSEVPSAFTTAIFNYRHPAIRRAIWRFKYENARDIATHFGRPLYDEIIGEVGNDLRIASGIVFLLVPIPLHPKRLRERGYNQSELLSREILNHDTEDMFELVPGALARTRQTKPQAKKEKRVARFENLRGAFLSSPQLVHGRHVILIDDVTTTGATLSEARKSLLKAGAKTVRAYTVAH